MKKRTYALLLALAMLIGSFAGCAKNDPNPSTATPTVADAELTIAPTATTAPTEAPAETVYVDFTDSCGRTVKVPENITRIAVSGPLSQIYLIPLAGDLLVGVSKRFSDTASEYISADILSKPEIGQLYGGKGELDLEALLAADPQVVIDIGEAKKSIVEDMDSLTAQTGIPFIHIDATVETAPDAYTMLGVLLNRGEKAEQLANWCRMAYTNIVITMLSVEQSGQKKSILYCLGSTGTNVLAEGSYHAETINKVGNNLAKLDNVVGSGNGNEVDLEQILSWNPDVIFFAPDSIYDTVGSDPAWSSVSAIANKTYYKAPAAPYGWISSPPSVQRYLGMLWMAAVLYPDNVNYDLKKEVTDYYKLFYGYDLTDAKYEELTKGSLR